MPQPTHVLAGGHRLRLSSAFVGAQIHCARIRMAHTRVFWPEAITPVSTATRVFWPKAIAARWSCGPHVTPTQIIEDDAELGYYDPPTA
jgi:hypothetical protein